MTSKEEMSRRQQALRDMIADEQKALREIYGYDKGVEAERERIIRLIEVEAAIFSTIVCDYEFKLPDGNDVIEVNDAWNAFMKQVEGFIKLIKGENE